MERLHRHVPNTLTLARLVLAGVFFLVLNQYRAGHPWADVVIWAAIGLFVLAVFTDFLDGYLARRWKVESTFGRIMDPFCDKVLIIGAFAYLAGPRFVMAERVAAGEPLFMATGVYPWMVVVILARELLVTGVRGEMESRGIEFGAGWSGKWKMALQSITVPAVLFIVWLDPAVHGWAAIVRDVLVYATVVVTIASGIPYITRAMRATPPNPG